MKNCTVVIYFLMITLVGCAQSIDQTINTPSAKTINAKLIVPELEIPWGFDFLPDGSLLLTEKKGTLLHFKDGKKAEIKGPPEVVVMGQGGLMDVKIHPDFVNNRWIYLSYASSEGNGKGGNTAIMRAQLRNNQLSQQEVLYKAGPNSDKPYHFGSRLAFDDEGYLYFSIGDRGNRDENPQDITKDCGKIYRLHDDGRIPSDNPFVNKKDAKKAIFSYGHRNPQGMTKHPETGAIWIHEHGPRGGDELNVIAKGKNYGWPVITYGINYSGTKITDETTKPGMEQPLYYWVPSIAPSGLAVLSSDKYPGWKSNVFAGSLAFQYLERLVIENNKVVYREKLLDGMGRVRCVNQGPDGLLYVGIEGKGIYRLDPVQ
ncbi:MAG: PQQ-dependent sugar dehydrogenase [Bacteroidota bacterium]